MIDQSDPTLWRDGVPISTRFDDPYYSLDSGIAETQHVFIDGNDLAARMDHDLHVAELGFGTGLNFLVTWDLWQRNGGQGNLRFTSFEAFPMPADTRAQALSAFPALAPLAAQMPQDLTNGPVDIAPNVTLNVIVGDAQDTLRLWDGAADAWFLDGFSPAKNPDLWGAELMQQVFDHTKPGGSFATYTAAGDVRRALATAGFEVTRVPGFGRKRHMSVGRKP